MINFINKISYILTLTILVLTSTYYTAGQRRPPREVREPRERERSSEKVVKIEKVDRWSKEQNKENFRSVSENKLIQRKMTERTPPSRGGQHVEKSSKWTLKDKFNSAANPGWRKTNDGGNGGKNNPPTGGGGNSPSGRSLKEKFNEAANPPNPPPPPPRKSGGNPGGDGNPTLRPKGPTFKPGGF